MSILKVAQMGHPILRRVAEPVKPELIPATGYQRFLDDLLETMEEYDGAGLAAPQVHTSLRAVVLTLTPDRGPEHWTNPVLTPLTTERVSTYEGCLSIEGLRAAVARPPAMHVRFFDRRGRARAYLLTGFPAVVAQHECDHLDGVLFVDRCDPRTLAFLPEFRRFGPLEHDAELDEQPDDSPPGGEPMGDDELTEADAAAWPDSVRELDPAIDPNTLELSTEEA